MVVQKASSTANKAVSGRLVSAEVNAIATIAAKIPSCDSMIQPSRLPKKRPNPGTENRSSKGAQTNLKVGSNCTQPKKPIRTRSTSCLASRADRIVENM